jgi:hypothetical protein
VQFVDARKLQERVQQQVGRGEHGMRRRGQLWGVWRRPQVEPLGWWLDVRGALFGLAVCGMNGQRMWEILICRGAVVAVAHQLLWVVHVAVRVRGGGAADARPAMWPERPMRGEGEGVEGSTRSGLHGAVKAGELVVV